MRHVPSFRSPLVAAHGHALALVACVLTGLLAGGCGRRLAATGAVPETEQTAIPTTTPTPGTSQPEGAACTGRDDCPTDQLCVRGVCGYRLTSAAGEVLAAAARAQVEAGDLEGAGRTWEQAFAAFEAAEAPVPVRVLCGAAATSLRAARTAEARETAAKSADRCFRHSLPGAPERADVQLALARLRYDGLDLARFDQPEPADRFFSAPPSRPTVDAIDLAIDITEQPEQPGFADLRAAVLGEPARQAIADCFIQDWELRHERQATASLVVKLTSRLRDMGDYDTYDAAIEVQKTTLAEDGFETCVAAALGVTLATRPRMTRLVAWQTPLEIAARLQ
jgi:hypothetical protein